MAMNEYNGEEVKAFGSDFFSLNEFLGKVKVGDLVSGTIENHYRTKDTFKIVGAFIRLVGNGLPHENYNGYIPRGFGIANEDESFENNIHVGESAVFRVQQIDTTGEKLKVTLSLPSFAKGAKPFKAQVRPYFERAFDANAPIDNTGVELGEGEHDICVVPSDFSNLKAQMACDKLRISINALEKENDSIRQVLNIAPEDGINIVAAKTSVLINGLLPPGMPVSVYIRNLSFNQSDTKWPVSYAGLRLSRTPGDWMDTNLGLPQGKTLLLTGRIFYSGSGFTVEGVSVVANEAEALPYEVKAEIFNYRQVNEVEHPFMNSLLGNMVSLSKYTDVKLTEWNQYLDWQENIAQLQIKGAKYIDVNVNREERLLEFTLVFPDKETFVEQKKILKRPELVAYPNCISSKEFEFEYSKPDFRSLRKIRASEIGKVKGLLREFSFSEGGSELNISAELLDKILKVFNNPYFATYSFYMDDNDTDELDRMIKQLEGTEDGEEKLDAFIKERILSKYRFSQEGGFLALSAVGELALINRLRRSIKSIRNGDSLNPHLSEWMFDVTKVRVPDETDNVEIDHWLDPNIANNPSQREAVLKILRSKDLFLLQGPPGNGKTTVIAESIYQLAIRGNRILLASQSNDAVDNALDKLKTSPAIRSVRMNCKREDLDENMDIPSEKNCLKYFYKAIAKDISTSTLERWEKDLNAGNSLQKDLRDYRLKVEDINRYQGELNEVNESLQKLYSSRDQKTAEYEKACRTIENTILQKRNLEKFLKFTEGENVDFSLFDDQLKIVEQVASSMNDNDFSLFNGAAEKANSFQRNQYIKLFLANTAAVKKMLTNAKSIKAEASIAQDLKIQELKQQISKLQDLQGGDITDSEYIALDKKITTIKLEIRGLIRQNNNAVFSMNETQKGIVSENLQVMFKTDYNAFISLLEKKVVQLDEAMSKICSDLTAYTTSINTVDASSIQRELNSIAGKITVAENDRINRLNSLQRVQQFLNELRAKYKLEQTSDLETLGATLEAQLALVQHRINGSQKERETFQDLLMGFKDHLEQQTNDTRQVMLNTEFYGSDYIRECNVVGVSCTTDPRSFESYDFDVVIIDEVSKATPPELLPTISRARKTVLVGDHRQLPPMFKQNERSYNEMAQEIQESEDYSDEEKKLLTEENFAKYRNMVTASLFKDMFRKAPSSIKATLETHYRCHPQIMSIFNYFYNGSLISGLPHDRVEELKAHNLTIAASNGRPFVTLQNHAYWIDSSALPNGDLYYENHPQYTTSCCNFLEEAISLELLQKINVAAMAIGYSKKSPMKVALISFYQAQINNIRKKVRGMHLDALSVSINTVDRFQGQERGVVIVNLVRNKPAGSDGKFHVGEHVLAYERINVALSRAQNLLFVVGAKTFFESLTVKLPTADDSDEISTKVYQNIIGEMYRNGCVFPSSSVLKVDDVAVIKAETEKNNCQTPQAPRYNRSRPKFKRSWRY